LDRLGENHGAISPCAAPSFAGRHCALIINLSCAFMLARVRTHGGSLTKAAFLSARNDALANVAIIVAGLVTVYTRSGWPDIVVGLGIAAMNADAAREVWSAARLEHRTVNV
jgi:Co/Zn/Cd efflux system component